MKRTLLVLSFIFCAVAFVSCTKKTTEGVTSPDTTTLAPTGETNVATETTGAPADAAVQDTADDFPADEGSVSDEE